MKVRVTRAEVLAARIKVKTDQRSGKETPANIVRLSQVTLDPNGGENQRG